MNGRMTIVAKTTVVAGAGFAPATMHVQVIVCQLFLSAERKLMM